MNSGNGGQRAQGSESTKTREKRQRSFSAAASTHWKQGHRPVLDRIQHGPHAISFRRRQRSSRAGTSAGGGTSVVTACARLASSGLSADSRATGVAGGHRAATAAATAATAALTATATAAAAAAVAAPKATTSVPCPALQTTNAVFTLPVGPGSSRCSNGGGRLSAQTTERKLREHIAQHSRQERGQEGDQSLERGRWNDLLHTVRNARRVLGPSW